MFPHLIWLTDSTNFGSNLTNPGGQIKYPLVHTKTAVGLTILTGLVISYPYLGMVFSGSITLLSRYRTATVSNSLN